MGVFREATDMLPAYSARFLAGDVSEAGALQSGVKRPYTIGAVSLPALDCPGARNLMFPPGSRCPGGGLPREGVDAIRGVTEPSASAYTRRPLEEDLFRQQLLEDLVEVGLEPALE